MHVSVLFQRLVSLIQSVAMKLRSMPALYGVGFRKVMAALSSLAATLLNRYMIRDPPFTL